MLQTVLFFVTLGLTVALFLFCVLVRIHRNVGRGADVTIVLCITITFALTGAMALFLFAPTGLTELQQFISMLATFILFVGAAFFFGHRLYTAWRDAQTPLYLA